MTAADYNRLRAREGEVTAEDLIRLLARSGRPLETAVRSFQRLNHLAVDGRIGPATVAALRALGRSDRCWPLPELPDGRRPVITSRFKSSNPSRPTHNGIDLFYAWLDSDPETPTGDGGAVKRKGQRRWWYPPGVQILAAGAGTVTTAGRIATGWRCWVTHADGTRTGYFHCRRLLVDVGAVVALGEPIAEPGDSPRGHDATHLHFEVSAADRYEPQDPELWLAGARFVG